MDLFCFVYHGGPHDGAVEWLRARPDAAGYVALCHLTDEAYHTYASANPVYVYGPTDGVPMFHCPERTTLRSETSADC